MVKYLWWLMARLKHRFSGRLVLIRGWLWTISYHWTVLHTTPSHTPSLNGLIHHHEPVLTIIHRDFALKQTIINYSNSNGPLLRIVNHCETILEHHRPSWAMLVSKPFLTATTAILVRQRSEYSYHEYGPFKSVATTDHNHQLWNHSWCMKLCLLTIALMHLPLQILVD